MTASNSVSTYKQRFFTITITIKRAGGTKSKMPLHFIFWRPFLFDWPPWNASQMSPRRSRLRCQKVELNTYQRQPDTIRPIRDQMRGIWPGAWKGWQAQDVGPELNPSLEVRFRRLISIATWCCFSAHKSLLPFNGAIQWDSRGCQRDQSEKGQWGANEREATKVRQSSTRPSLGVNQWFNRNNELSHWNYQGDKLHN